VPATSLVDFQDGGKLLLALAVSADKHYLVAGQGGYGFLVKGEDLLSRGKSGKAFLSLDAGEKPAVFQPAPVPMKLPSSPRTAGLWSFRSPKSVRSPRGAA